jgi:glucose-1-phosphate cytidylyltransferase
MKVVILAGGFGTRISEESHLRPKPMIEIGEKPILWHIMKHYSQAGYNDFVICCGYKADFIKRYFAEYYLHNSDVTFDFSQENQMHIHDSVAEPWRVTLVDTGLNTMTGGRVKRVQSYVGDEPFFLTYGDGVADVNVNKEVQFHRSHGKLATMTAVSVAQRFGVLDVEPDKNIRSFREKRERDASLINGGFMVLEPQVFDYIDGDETVFESETCERLAQEGQLMAFVHDGFWQCMDTQRDKMKLEELWSAGTAPWKTWAS